MKITKQRAMILLLSASLHGALFSMENKKTDNVQKQQAKRMSIKQYNSQQSINLLKTIEQANFEMVQDALGNGADPNARHLDDTTPLHHACASKNPKIEIVTLLLMYGAEVNAKDKLNRTALHYAAKTGPHNEVEIIKLKIMKLLLAQGADLSITDVSGYSCLHEACCGPFWYIKKIKLLLNEGADPNIQVNKLYLPRHGATPLHRVCGNGKATVDVIKPLVEHGADVNIEDGGGRTALHMACWYIHSNNHQKIIKFLLEHGSNCDVMVDNEPLLHWACKNMKKDIVEAILSWPASCVKMKENFLQHLSPLAKKRLFTFLCCVKQAKNQNEFLGQLPRSILNKVMFMTEEERLSETTDWIMNTAHLENEAGYTVKELMFRKDEDGNRALDVSSSAMVVFLIANFCCNKELFTQEERTYLVKYCVECDHLLKCAKFLLQTPIDVNKWYSQEDGNYLLRKAINKNDVLLVQQLIKQGAIDHTALFYAYEQGQYDVVQCMIELGFNINTRGHDAQTLLHTACKVKNKPLAYALIKAGAEINPQDMQWKTPLHIVLDIMSPLPDVPDEDFELIELLVNAGADPQITDRDGKTAYWVAEKNYKRIRELFDEKRVTHDNDNNI